MKHILILLLSVITVSAQHVAINVGVTNNDGTGDSIRSAFAKVNTNFANIYTNASGAFTNRTLTGSTVATNLNGIAIFSTNWTAGTGSPTYKTNTLLTFAAYNKTAIVDVSFAAWESVGTTTVAAKQSASFSWYGLTAVAIGVVGTNLTANSSPGGIFFTTSGSNVLVSAWCGAETTWTGKGLISVMTSP